MKIQRYPRGGINSHTNLMKEYIQNLIKFDTKFSYKFNEGIYREIRNALMPPTPILLMITHPTYQRTAILQQQREKSYIS